jgi:hypothetical protein
MESKPQQLTMRAPLALAVAWYLFDPVGFTGEVGVVGTGFCTDFDQQFTVQRVGADGGDYHAGLAAHGL